MIGPVRILAIAALLVVPALAAPATAQSGTRPIADEWWELARLDEGAGSTAPPDIGFAPRNATFDARFRFLAREAINDTLAVRVEDGQVNRSTIPVDVAAGEVFSTLVEVSRIREAGGESATLVATLRNTTWNGGVLQASDRISVIPQPRAELVRPPNVVGERGDPEYRERGDARLVVGGHRSLEADWNEEVEVRARLENPWDVPTRPLPLRIVGQGQVVEGRTVAPLAPGETRTVTVANVSREEVTRSLSHGRDPVRASPASVRLSLAAATGEPDERESLWNYSYPSTDLGIQAPAQGVVSFHAGLDVNVPFPDLELGEAASLTVEVRNRGGVPARPTPVDLRVGPVPDLAYGVESGARRSLTVDLAPGESRSVDLSLTPRVGAPHEVGATIEKPSRSRGTGHVADVESPVDLRVAEEPVRSLEVGETVEVPVVVEGPADLKGKLGVVATVRQAEFGFDGPSGGTPFSMLLTTGDLVDASFGPPRLDPGAGEGPTNRTVTVELTPKAAGKVAVVPLLRSDGIVHTGLEDGEAVRNILGVTRFDEPEDERRGDRIPQGIVGLQVFPTGRPGPAVVAPPALVLLGVAGVEVHRRWYLR